MLWLKTASMSSSRNETDKGGKTETPTINRMLKGKKKNRKNTDLKITNVISAAQGRKKGRKCLAFFVFHLNA